MCRIRWAVAALSAALSVALSVPAAADSNDDKARVDRALAQASSDLEGATDRARQAAVEYANAVAALPAAQSALAEARGRVIGAEAAVRAAERETAAARTVQAAADGSYDTAAGHVRQARADAGRFASATYKGSGFLLLDSIVSAGSPSEFAVRLGYLEQVAGDHRRALERLTTARASARDTLSVAQAARQRADQAAGAAAEALARSRSAVATAEQAAAAVQALTTRREAALVQANAERASLQASYQQLQAESARIEAQLRAAAARSRGGAAPAPAAPRPGAHLLMPVAGWKTSGFGMRFHPVFRIWRLHTGMDIGAGGGTSIVAAADGEVVSAGWRGGYGNYTCVGHGVYQGRGLASCYAHQSRILVVDGQRVRRGQVIGRVGSTGVSTGAHLHFEVRLNGSPVDPAPWLPGCLC